MSRKELFDIWAPRESIWSPWVSPALFAQIDCEKSSKGADPISRIWFEGKASPDTAVIADLVGVDSVRLAATLAQRGYRPILIVNASPGPLASQATAILPMLGFSPSSVVLDTTSLIKEVCAQTDLLLNFNLGPNAPPAFILDARRLRGSRPLQDDLFDNRWMVFTQDFPSASFLSGHGIKRVILVQDEKKQPQEDLSAVLLRWQDRGIAIFAQANGSANPPSRIIVKKPSVFTALWKWILAAVGLKQNNVGGFGSLIPETWSSG
jgi:hypothetical protein